MKIILQEYIFEIEENVIYQKYLCPPHLGIIFIVNNNKYDIICNYYMGHRLIINFVDGSWKDLPFRENTYHLLPKEIKIIL